MLQQWRKLASASPRGCARDVVDSVGALERKEWSEREDDQQELRIDPYGQEDDRPSSHAGAADPSDPHYVVTRIMLKWIGAVLQWSVAPLTAGPFSRCPAASPVIALEWD